MSKTVSIIIPVYNTPHEYLEACFSSVKAQNYPSIEVVVVDDGSCVETASWLESECGDDFKLVHKENGGLSDARNFGIEMCCGEYVNLLDSDDELAFDGAIATLVEAAVRASADMVIGAYHYEGIVDGPQSAMNGPKWLKECLKSGLSFSAADQLYSRELLSSMDTLFRVGLVHEDEEFTPRALMSSSLVVGLPGVKTYTRNEREGSITKSVTAKSCFERCEGKLIVARDSLDDARYSADFELRRLMDERAYSFANMAFRAWAEYLCGSEYEQRLIELAEQIDYFRLHFSTKNAHALRNWVCMRLLRTVGVRHYVALLRRVCL